MERWEGGSPEPPVQPGIASVGGLKAPPSHEPQADQTKPGPRWALRPTTFQGACRVERETVGKKGATCKNRDAPQGEHPVPRDGGGRGDERPEGPRKHLHGGARDLAGIRGKPTLKGIFETEKLGTYNKHQVTFRNHLNFSRCDHGWAITSFF